VVQIGGGYAPSWQAIAIASVSRPLGILAAEGRLMSGTFNPRISQAPPCTPGDGRAGAVSTSILLLLALDDDVLTEELDRRPPMLGLEPPDDRLFSLKCVSRCCFMLSARVNFLVQPLKVHWTAFSAVWILECREAWPEVVKVFSQPWLSRYLHGYRLPTRSFGTLPAGLPASSSYELDRLSAYDPGLFAVAKNSAG